MKNTFLPAFVICAFALACLCYEAPASIISMSGSSITVVNIKADGSCSITNTAIQPRKQLESQVRLSERFLAMSEGTDDEDAPAEKASKAEPAPMTDEELLKKVREMYEQNDNQFGMRGASMKLERLGNAGSNQVEIVTSSAFGSVKEMLGQARYQWKPSMLLFMQDDSIQITNDQLRITFSPVAESRRMGFGAEKYLKSIRARQEWTLMLPGKVVSSDFPVTNNNSISLILDPANPDTVNAMVKLIKLPELNVVAETGGLKIDGVLKSSELAQRVNMASQEPEVPVRDAGPGFLTEPQSIELTTIHDFPEVKQLKESIQGEMFLSNGSEEGTAVQVKIYPPKGRIIKGAKETKVKQAKDDQGRSIQALPSKGGVYSRYSSSDNNKAINVELEFGLPEPDAKAIDEVQCEVVLTTIAGYQDFVLTNVQEVIKKEVDLSSIVPKAKLVIAKASNKGMQKTLDLTVTGPKEVHQLEFSTRIDESRMGHTSAHNRKVSEKDGIVTRTVQIQSYEYGARGTPKDGPITLKVSMPQDFKNERLQFTLTALDLL